MADVAERTRGHGGYLAGLFIVAIACTTWGCKSKTAPAEGEASGTSSAGASPPAVPAPAPDEVPKSGTPSDTGGSGSGSNAACAQAEACCRLIIAKLPNDPKTLAACLELRKLPDNQCIPMHEKYRQAARSLGITCN